MIESARAKGLHITADIYLYTAGANRLSSRLPAWAHAGGDETLLERLKDPVLRKKIAKEMRLRGRMPRTILVGFNAENFRPLTGKTLEEAARIHGKDQVETMLDLISEDSAATRVATFVMSEEKSKKSSGSPGYLLDRMLFRYRRKACFCISRLIPAPMETSPGCWENTFEMKR